jgi:hypothetical protein
MNAEFLILNEQRKYLCYEDEQSVKPSQNCNLMKGINEWIF